MKFKLFLLPVILALLSCATLYADPDFGIQLDYNKFKDADSGDTGIGVRGVFGSSLSLITSFDYYFSKHLDNLKFYEINGNIRFQFVGRNQVRSSGQALCGISLCISQKGRHLYRKSVRSYRRNPVLISELVHTPPLSWISLNSG